MCSRKVYDLSSAVALVGGELGESDDENLVDSEDDEDYLPPAQSYDLLQNDANRPDEELDESGEFELSVTC